MGRNPGQVVLLLVIVAFAVTSTYYLKEEGKRARAKFSGHGYDLCGDVTEEGGTVAIKDAGSVCPEWMGIARMMNYELRLLHGAVERNFGDYAAFVGGHEHELGMEPRENHSWQAKSRHGVFELADDWAESIKSTAAWSGQADKKTAMAAEVWATAVDGAALYGLVRSLRPRNVWFIGRQVTPFTGKAIKEALLKNREDAQRKRNLAVRTVYGPPSMSPAFTHIPAMEVMHARKELATAGISVGSSPHDAARREPPGNFRIPKAPDIPVWPPQDMGDLSADDIRRLGSLDVVVLTGFGGGWPLEYVELLLSQFLHHLPPGVFVAIQHLDNKAHRMALKAFLSYNSHFRVAFKCSMLSGTNPGDKDNNKKAAAFVDLVDRELRSTVRKVLQGSAAPRGAHRSTCNLNSRDPMEAPGVIVLERLQNDGTTILDGFVL